MGAVLPKSSSILNKTIFCVHRRADFTDAHSILFSGVILIIIHLFKLSH